MQSHLLCRTCFSQYQASHAVSGKLSREKTFTNWWKIWFSWRKLLRIALFCRAKGCHTPKFRGEKTFANSHKTAKFAKFSLSKVSCYMVHCVYMHIQCMCTCTWMSKELRAGGCQVFLSHWSENQIKRETLSLVLIRFTAGIFPCLITLTKSAWHVLLITWHLLVSHDLQLDPPTVWHVLLITWYVLVSHDLQRGCSGPSPSAGGTSRSSESSSLPGHWETRHAHAHVHACNLNTFVTGTNYKIADVFHRAKFSWNHSIMEIFRGLNFRLIMDNNFSKSIYCSPSMK